MLPGRVARPGFSPLTPTRIENLSCSNPAAQGLELTHWSARSLQLAARQLEMAPAIHYTTIAEILRTATLQPHRWRYWKSTVWDPAAIQRAAKVLWCYERVDWLLERGILVICMDEKPGLQVLERAQPIRRMIPGHIEQQEFEYVRHGTVNLLVACSPTSATNSRRKAPVLRQICWHHSLQDLGYSPLAAENACRTELNVNGIHGK